MPPPPTPLTGKQSRHLRALAHGLRPTVLIGKAGITDPLLSEIDAALLAHELIKVKVASDAPLETKEAGASLAEHSGGQVAQVIGHVVVLYRAHPKQPKIVLPRRNA